MKQSKYHLSKLHYYLVMFVFGYASGFLAMVFGYKMPLDVALVNGFFFSGLPFAFATFIGLELGRRVR